MVYFKENSIFKVPKESNTFKEWSNFFRWGPNANFYKKNL